MLKISENNEMGEISLVNPTHDPLLTAKPGTTAQRIYWYSS